MKSKKFDDVEVKTCSSYESVDEDRSLIVKIPTKISNRKRDLKAKRKKEESKDWLSLISIFEETHIDWIEEL